MEFAVLRQALLVGGAVAPDEAGEVGSRQVTSNAIVSSNGNRMVSAPGSRAIHCAKACRPVAVIVKGRRSRAWGAPASTSPASLMAVSSRYTWLRLSVQKSPISVCALATRSQPLIGPS